MQKLIEITDSALTRLKQLLAQREKPSLGIKIGIKTKGCSGLAYYLEYVDHPPSEDEKVSFDDVEVFIDKKAMLYVLGTKMDYVENKINSGFIFINPQEKGRCGCGKSFHI